MNSVLNPEAPEFYPHLTSVTQGGYKSMHKSVVTANALTRGKEYEFKKTFTDFNIVAHQISENVVIQSNQIIACELPDVSFIRTEHEYNGEKLIDVNDSLLERININIEKSSQKQPSDNVFQGLHTKPTISSWNHSPVIAKIQVGSATLIGAKNIARPQLNFKDAIDNSESLWVPRISDKPNSIKPLALNILYNDEGEAVGYEHPYKVELDLYHPPSKVLEPDSEEAPFPGSLEHTKFTYIDTGVQLDALVEHLNTVSELAVDLEHHSYRTYQGITCLIQISTNEGGDFIIDALAIREHIHKLNLAFTDPKKTKIFHGAESDVIWLQRDFGVYVVGLFDTHQAAKVLKLGGLSLKFLLMEYCRIDADKKYQLADWRMRPLPEELILYARMDTHYLLYIWRQMRAQLLKASSGQPQLLLSVFENSRQICGATYNKEVMTESSHMPLYIRSRKLFTTQQMAALKMMYKWRDTQARLLDESITYLLPNHMLLALVETLPRELQGVNAICSPMPPFVKQNLLTIHKMLLSCRALPSEPQLYHMPANIMSMMNFEPIKYDVHDLHPEFGEDYRLDQAVDIYEVYNQLQPQEQIPLTPTQEHSLITYENIVSDLNAEAKNFVPPFDRYKRYRSLAQMEEMKDFREKEAKIVAISKGNELIKKEVLVKLQQAKTHIEHEEKTAVPSNSVEIDDSEALNKTQQRKRKISAEKVEQKESVDDATEPKKEIINTGNKKVHGNVNPYAYKNVDYKKFYNDNSKEHKQKQPKMKFKKYKK